MSIEFLGDHGAFAPMDPQIEILNVGGGGGGGHHMPEPMPPRFAEPVQEERRPSMAQRMSTIDVRDGFEDLIKPRRDPRRNSFLSTKSVPTTKSVPDYLFHFVEKEGESWRFARTSTLPIPLPEMQKRVKKGKGKVADQMSNMSSLRREHIQRLADEANYNEDGQGQWEVGTIENTKEIRTRAGIEVRAMNVILVRRPIPIKANTSKSKSQNKTSGKVVDALEPVKEKKKDKGDSKGDGDGDFKGKSKPDPALADPLQEPILFHNSGRPMDARGPIEFTDAGLPDIIPKEKPIGARSERGSSKKRSKSRDAHSGIMNVGDPVVEGGAGDALTLEAILGETPTGGGGGGGGGGRGRRSSSRRTDPVVEVFDEQRRSHSRRRPSSRSRSRFRSRSRRASAHFPNSHTRTYLDGSSGSSAASFSDDSRYGFEDYERSSHTSQDTHDRLTGRGSLYHQDSAHRSRAPRQHHRGPSRKSYHEDMHVVIPHRPAAPRRASAVSVRYVIPESRQIEYHDRPRELVRSRTYDVGPRSPTFGATRPIVVYPDEIDFRRQEVGAESYMRDTVREEYLDDRERNLARRERAADGRDWERRQSQYEPPPTRRFSRSGGYVDPRDGRYYYD